MKEGTRRWQKKERRRSKGSQIGTLIGLLFKVDDDDDDVSNFRFIENNEDDFETNGW